MPDNNIPATVPDDCAKDDFVEREIERIVGGLKQPLHEYMSAAAVDAAPLHDGDVYVIALLRQSLGDIVGQYSPERARAIAQGLSGLILAAKKMRGVSWKTFCEARGLSGR